MQPRRGVLPTWWKNIPYFRLAVVPSKFIIENAQILRLEAAEITPIQDVFIRRN